ncbi:MAG: hypothetical protein COS84_08445 [Armatimonadetes bacterium CG07_land_8_20_14_0_80_40_9]|nr:MAG: hypothetical protein COS84_08445 [Armatimonadetes bacterium CG07_land_8_20_14_0_80_40_9]
MIRRKSFNLNWSNVFCLVSCVLIVALLLLPSICFSATYEMPWTAFGQGGGRVTDSYDLFYITGQPVSIKESEVSNYYISGYIPFPPWGFSSFSMISIPMPVGESIAPGEIFNIDSEFDLARWSPEGLEYHYYKPNPSDEYLKIKCGQGYWIKTGQKIYLQTPPEDEVTVSLKVGWNQIGNPYDFDVEWSNNDNSSIADYASYYDPSSSSCKIVHPTFEGAEHNLKPFQGYFVYAGSVANFVIYPIEASAKQKKEIQPEISAKNWRVRLKVDSEGFEDSFNFAGVADESKYRYQFRESPLPIGSYVSLYFVREGRKYTVDFRQPFSNSQTWDFEVGTDMSNKKITLRWDLSQSPEDFQFTLIDLDNNRKQDMRSSCIYTYNSQAGDITHFQMKVEAKAKPAKIERLFNYPNPFSLTTGTKIRCELDAPVQTITVRIYTISGELIKTINAFNDLGGNIYEISWNGINDFGKAVANGIYIYQVEITDLEGGTQTMTKKMAVIK